MSTHRFSSDVKYCNVDFNERNTFLVIGSIKTTKSNNIIRRLEEPTKYFPMNRLYGPSIKIHHIFCDAITAFPKCNFLDPSGWKRIDAELKLCNVLKLPTSFRMHPQVYIMQEFNAKYSGRRITISAHLCK
ncbi:hypothetical protein PVAP13_6KG029735 [Panicum virgatum]|uniref:Uncharacterized protein n=1 Tax=Panicum virgatum TaxID=38727 RepID=A0A8T0R8D3_PANVG|nr:hypothetical protein PVAP13_6KG029735 [Panicum virgatum]